MAEKDAVPAGGYERGRLSDGVEQSGGGDVMMQL